MAKGGGNAGVDASQPFCSIRENAYMNIHTQFYNSVPLCKARRRPVFDDRHLVGIHNAHHPTHSVRVRARIHAQGLLQRSEIGISDSFNYL
jgi:hypothetical protein